MTNFETFSYIPKSKIKKAIVFLHGFADSGHGVLPIASFIANKLGDNVAAFCPNAPDVSEGYAEGYQWFKSHSKNFIDYEGQLDSHLKLVAYIDEICKTYSIKYSDIILIGFSQGCMQAVFSAMRLTNKLYALICISGLLNWADKDIASFKNLPKTFVCAGAEDTVVEPKFSTDMATAMENGGASVELKIYQNVAHSTVFNKAVLPIIAFLK